MYNYTWSQWMAFFYFYCFFGWCFESAYVSLMEKRPVNRGFLRGPVLPLYGTGALMMLFVSEPFEPHTAAVFFSGMAGATVLEYVTGVVMEGLFKVKYWDYSDQKLNFRGYICLSSSAAWGVLTLFLTRLLHPAAEWGILRIGEDTLSVLVIFITALFSFDVITSVIAALDFARALEAMTKARGELENLKVQLALMTADARDLSADRLGLIRGAASVGLAEAKAAYDKRVEQARAIPERGFVKLADLKEDLQERLAAAKASRLHAPELGAIEERIRQFRMPVPSPSKFYAYMERELLKGNPGATARRFKEAFLEMKEKYRGNGGNTNL